jgi:hypothetical protein
VDNTKGMRITRERTIHIKKIHPLGEAKEVKDITIIMITKDIMMGDIPEVGVAAEVTEVAVQPTAVVIMVVITVQVEIEGISKMNVILMYLKKILIKAMKGE